MPSFYACSVPGFLQDNPQRILGLLTEQSAHAHFTQQVHTQTTAWLHEIEILQSAFAQIAASQAVSAWHVFLEYPIPRRAKRIDAVVLTSNSIVVIEFKCGRATYD